MVPAANLPSRTFTGAAFLPFTHSAIVDDTIYSGCGADIVFGDAQNDTIVLGWGADWSSGGTGADAILGDDGRLHPDRA